MQTKTESFTEISKQLEGIKESLDSLVDVLNGTLKCEVENRMRHEGLAEPFNAVIKGAVYTHDPDLTGREEEEALAYQQDLQEAEEGKGDCPEEIEWDPV